jgi:hypothetical protein
MATDVKLGLVVGLGVVLAVAVTYYPKAGPRTGAGAVVPSLPAAGAPSRERSAAPTADTASARLDRR